MWPEPKKCIAFLRRTITVLLPYMRPYALRRLSRCKRCALLLVVPVLRMQPAVFGIGPCQKAAMVAVKTKENTMQVISVTDLSRLTRAQLFSLLTQFQATLADLAPDSPEYLFANARLANIRLVLSQKSPSP